MGEIIAFEGPLSSGKTKTAVELIKLDIKDKKRVVSNIHLQGINHTYIQSEDLANFIIQNHTPDKYEIIKHHFDYSVFLIDEIYQLLSSKRSSSNMNEIITQFMMMMGKLDTDVLYTLQRFMMLEINVRNITNKLITCERIDHSGKPYTKYRIPYYTPDGKIIPEQLKGPNDKLLPLWIRCKIYDVITSDELKFTGLSFVHSAIKGNETYNTRELIIVDREKYLKK